jgi:hypothetical protein
MKTKMKVIRVSSEEQFERLRNRIDLQASHAADHFHLLRGWKNYARNITSK